jgi:hypothetical protein
MVFSLYLLKSCPTRARRIELILLSGIQTGPIAIVLSRDFEQVALIVE